MMNDLLSGDGGATMAFLMGGVVAQERPLFMLSLMASCLIASLLVLF